MWLKAEKYVQKWTFGQRIIGKLYCNKLILSWAIFYITVLWSFILLDFIWYINVNVPSLTITIFMWLTVIIANCDILWTDISFVVALLDAQHLQTWSHDVLHGNCTKRINVVYFFLSPCNMHILWMAVFTKNVFDLKAVCFCVHL